MPPRPIACGSTYLSGRSPARTAMRSRVPRAARERTTLGDMRILVTGGAGFIGSHFVKRMLRAGEDVVVLDKLTYSGNRANLPEDVELHVGDIAEPGDVVKAAHGCDTIVNFAAETHVDRSILSSTDFGRTEFHGVQMLLEHVRESGS